LRQGPLELARRNSGVLLEKACEIALGAETEDVCQLCDRRRLLAQCAHGSASTRIALP
jgi:hypothetical protein